MPFINCHAHTVISDGSDTMLDMAKKAKELGHSALVITDHNYPIDRNFKTGWRERDVLEETDQAPLPIIVGAEISTPFGDHLLFGKEALRNWEHYKGLLEGINRDFDLNLWVEVFRTYVLAKASLQGMPGFFRRYKVTPMPYAMILCHPRDQESYYAKFPDEWWELCHGFEIQNGRQEYETFAKETVRLLRNKMPGGMELRNSDAHTSDQMNECWNEIPHEITREEQLCKWLRSGRKNWRLNNKEVLKTWSEKFADGMRPCPPEFSAVFNENLEDILA
jgi:hypothetical protein